MKKFILRIIIILLPLTIIPIVNYTIDPAHVYGHGAYEEKLCSMLKEYDTNVTNVDKNFNVRYFKKLLCLSTADSVNMLILGSSRVMNISQYNYPPSICNLGVSGAITEDIASLLYIYLENNPKPTKILMGTDPQFFNPDADSRWHFFDKEYSSYLAMFNKEGISRDKLQYEDFCNLFSITYFREALNYWKENKDLPPLTPISEQDSVFAPTYRPNGSSYGANQYKFGTTEEAATFVYGQWLNYQRVDTCRVEDFERLIQYIQVTNGIKLYFWFAPYHPATYNNLMTAPQYSGMREAMTLMREIAHKYDIQIIGSYNPSECNCNDSCFSDGMHFNRWGLERIVATFPMED